MNTEDQQPTRTSSKKVAEVKESPPVLLNQSHFQLKGYMLEDKQNLPLLANTTGYSIKMDSETYKKYYGMNSWDDCIDRLYITKEFADFTIIVGCKQLRVHKLILCISSPEFDQIICNSNAAQKDFMVIEDAEPDDVDFMLSHIYKRKVQFSSVEQALNVLSLAKRYRLPLLNEFCAKYVDEIIDAGNACMVYQRSLSLEEENLFYKSFQFIQKETISVLKQTDLRNVYSSTIRDILKQDYLNIASEYQLLETLIDWAIEQLKLHGMAESPEHLREVLNPFLKHIRFLCLTQENFAKIQKDTRIFNKEDVSNILMRFTIKDWSELPVWFNQCTASRRYKKDVKPKAISLVNWSNLNDDIYYGSERVRNITTKFIGKSNDFIIRRFVISICDKCFYRNSVCKRSDIKLKVAVRTESINRETSCVIPILSRHYSRCHSKTPDFHKNMPIIIRQYFDKEKLISRQYVGAEAPILRDYLDPDTSTLPEFVDMTSSLSSKTVEVVPPIHIKSGQMFSLSMETIENDLPFYCCKKKPLFDTAPFTVYTRVRKDLEEQHFYVWCAFASVDYFLPESERSLHE